MYACIIESVCCKWKFTKTCKSTVLVNQLNNKETMPFTATWVELEITILSEVSQREKDEHHTMLFTSGI